MTARRFCILDVEARLSPDAVLRVGLKEIYACATLVFDEAADGSFSNFELECCELGEGGEAALLMMPPSALTKSTAAAQFLLLVMDLTISPRCVGGRGAIGCLTGFSA